MAPPHASSQLAMLTNPFPHQGYIATQPTQSNATPPPSQSRPNNYHILMMNSDEFNPQQIDLQTRLRPYDKPPAK